MSKTIAKSNYPSTWPKLCRMLLALLVLCTVTPLLIRECDNPEPADAAGAVTANLTSITEAFSGHYFSVASAWHTQCSATSSDGYHTSSSSVGWTEGSTANTFWQTEDVFAFDLTSIPVGSQIIDVKLVNRIQQLNIVYTSYPSDWMNSYFSIYKTYPMDSTIQNSDWSVAYNSGHSNAVMAFAPKKFNSFTTDAVDYTWQMYSNYFAGLRGSANSDNRVYFTFASMRRMWDAAPNHYGAYSLILAEQPYGGAGPHLIVKYVPTPFTRTVYVDTNAAKNPAPTGLEIANNIAWGSPRCAYADETIYFKVYGDSGANITLKCVGGDGTLLAAQIDEVRVDGVYNWSFTVPSSYSGWIRAYEQNFGLYSTWGYIDRSPSPTMLNLTTYAHDTAYPQYDNPFSYYAVWKDGLMFVYWATNVASEELGSYALALWVSGNSSYGTMFGGNLSWLADYYYSINKTQNRYLAADRYAIFCPQIVSSGFNNGDGLVYNLNKEYDMSTCGFIVPVVYNNSTGEVITTCHTAYYYIQDWVTDGVKIVVDSMTQANGIIGVNIDIGKYSMIADRLSSLNVQLIDNLGYVYSTAYGSVMVGRNVAGLQAPENGGSFQIRCTFSSGSSPYYSLILDTPVTITGGATPTPPTTGPGGPPGSSLGDWTDWVKNFLKSHGLDNEAGHWLVILLLCALWVFLLRKNPTAMTGLIIITIGGGLIFQWLNPWFYALLILGAALTLFGLFKRKTKTADEG